MDINEAMAKFARNGLTMKARKTRKENTTDITSLMASLKKEIATMLKSGNNPRRTN